MDETIVYRRKELYEQVWQEPVRQVASKYGISDVGLAKICRKLDVPLPGRGFWARKEAGHEDERPPLRPLREGQEEEIRTWRRKPSPLLEQLSDEAKAALAREEDGTHRIQVP